jgi:hypothetical protein
VKCRWRERGHIVKYPEFRGAPAPEMPDSRPG